MKDKSAILINSAVLYVLAFLLTTIIHESFHAIFGAIFHSSPVMHHNFVEHFSEKNLSAQQLAIIALAGPMISLLQGLLSGFIFLKSKGQKLFYLFLLWFSVLGLNNFFGYLITGPLFKKGDIGKVYFLLNIPVWIQLLFAIAGAAALVFIAWKLTVPFLKFSYKSEWLSSSPARKNFSFHILFLPWLIGSVTITLLYLPIIALISIIYPVMSGMIFIFPWQNADRIENLQPSSDSQIGKLSIGSLVLLIAVALIFKFLLAPGIKLY